MGRHKKPVKAKTVRLGLAGYARMLALLRTGAMSAVEFESAAGVGHTTAHRLLLGLYALGLTHIASWGMEPDCPTLPRFTGFPGQDVAPPLFRPNGRPIAAVRMPRKIKPPAELAFFKLVLSCLEVPVTRGELKKATGINDYTARIALAALMKYRLAHIACWTSQPRPGGPRMANYMLGNAPSAHRPPMDSKAAVSKRYRERRAEREKFAPISIALGMSQATAREGRAST